MGTGDVIALIAGSGRLPVALAEAVKARGLSLVCVAVEGADPALAALADHFHLTAFGAVDRVLGILRSHRVRRVLFAGTVPRTRLLEDDAALRGWLPQTDRRDSALFAQGAARLAALGIEVASPLEFVSDLAIPAGRVTARAPTDRQWRDVAAGMALARTLAGMDVGQTVVLKDGVILAVEAAEGTDETILRAGRLAPAAVVVKAARPRQDSRFDLPVIGRQTIEAMAAARAAVLAAQAGLTLLVDRAASIAAADAAGIAIVGVEQTGVEHADSGPG